MIALILARGGSKRIPKKNIKMLGGKPLIGHVIESARNANSIKNVYVSSDCDDILEISESFGAIKIKRPDYLSSDSSKDIDSFIHSLTVIEGVEEIVHLRATTPLINPSILDKGIDFYLKNREICTSMRSVHKTSESVFKYYKKNGFFLENICDSQYEITSMPSQLVPSTFCPNGYIDILKVSTFQSKTTFYGDKILSFETEFTPEIDTIDDFDYIEYLYNKKNYIDFF